MLAEREAVLRQVTNPLPGSLPMDNRRPVNIRAAHDRWRLLDVLRARFPQIAPDEWAQRCDAGRFVNTAGGVLGKDHVVRAGEQLLQLFPLEIEPPVATDIRVLHEDEALVVVRKPAPLPMHPSGRFRRNTLQHLLNLVYAPEGLLPVHRLDANTTGLVLFARTRHCCRVLQRQFLDGSVDKHYLVRVLGHPPRDAFFCAAPISPLPGVLGTHSIDEASGQHARTDFRVLERRADGTSLLEAVLGTGRTNQIRLHLWHMGHAVVGDPAYLADHLLGDRQTLAPDAPPLQLHAWQLSFLHPVSGAAMRFETERPQWARDA
jgi:RluA family pseudouridine synthase